MLSNKAIENTLKAIYNEYAYPSGLFGWCYICRKTSNHYCINHKMSVCSFVCKNYLANEENQLINLNYFLE